MIRRKWMMRRLQNPDAASLMLFAHLCRLNPYVKELADIPAEINRKAKVKASARHLVKSACHQLSRYAARMFVQLNPVFVGTASSIH